MQKLQHNQKFIFIIFFSQMFVIIASQHAFADDTIIWVNDNLAPAFISKGPDKGKGIVDGVVEIYKKHLPEYKHQHLEANMPRILDLMHKGANVCYAGFFRTSEREKFVSFSIPNLINYMGVIVIKKNSRLSIFNNHNTLSLKKLLKQKQIKAGLTQGRSYGSIIDSILKNHENKSDHILFRAGEDSLQGLLKMLYTERIDYTIGSPWEIPYISKQIGKSNKFRTIFIQEGKDKRWIKNYIGCPKNKWGQNLIQKINKILLQVRTSKDHMYHQLKWFPKEMEKEIRNAFMLQINSIKQ